jgi:hypothetical protein
MNLLTALSSLISWSSPVTSKVDRALAITPATLFKLSSAVGIPTPFIEQMLENIFWYKHGNGLFINHDELEGQLSKLGGVPDF